VPDVVPKGIVLNLEAVLLQIAIPLVRGVSSLKANGCNEPLMPAYNESLFSSNTIK